MFQILSCKQVSFWWSSYDKFFTFFVLLLGDFAAYTVPKYSAEVLPSVLKCKKAVMHLTEKNMCIRLALFRHVIMLLAMSSMLMNQQYTILYTVSLTETHIKRDYG